MRLCKAVPRVPLVPLVVTAAAALAFTTSAPAQVLAAPGADRRPTCADAGGGEFPVRTRIHGGPDAYEVGGGYRTWYIDLTNATDETCGDIHPILVLVDEKQALRAGQARLEFYEGAGEGKGEGGGVGERERPHPVRFQTTGEHENIGVFDDGFPGFTVAPGATVSVTVRLAVTSDAVPNDVVANAAVVQRHDDDGDWVGESNDYRFRIVDEGTAGAGTPDPSASRPASPSSSSSSSSSSSVSRTPSPFASRSKGAREGLPFAEELAATGLDAPLGLLGAALVLFGAGIGALFEARRRR